MMYLKPILNRFRKSEDGNVTVQFVVLFPVFLFLLISAYELGSMTLRQTSLERALDVVVRDLRMTTGGSAQHDDIKADICEQATLISDCSTNLRLEMVQLDPRNWTTPVADYDCTDASVEAAPVRTFENGQENELMILRVCAKVDPLFPTIGLATQMRVDGAGQYALVAKTAFVQEPR